MEKNNELNGIVSTIKDLEESRNAYICENEELSQTIDELENELEELEEIHRKDQGVINDHVSTIQDIKRDNKNLHGTIELKDIEIKELRGIYRDYEELKRENENILKNMALCESQKSKLKEKINELDDVVKDKDYKLSRQENLLSQLQVKLNDYRKAIEDLSEENDCLSKRHNDCKHSLEEAALESDRLLEKIRVCENTRIKLEESNKKHLNCIKQIRTELDRESSNNKKLKKMISDLEEDNNMKKREGMQLREQIISLQDEVVEKQNEAERIWGELKKQSEEFETYKKTICNLKQKVLNNKNNILPACTSRAFSTTRSRSFNRRRSYRTQQVTMQCVNDSKAYMPNNKSTCNQSEFDKCGKDFKSGRGGDHCKVGDYCKASDYVETTDPSQAKCRETSSDLPGCSVKPRLTKSRKQKNKC